MKAALVFLGLAGLAVLVATLPGILGWGREEDETVWRE